MGSNESRYGFPSGSRRSVFSLPQRTRYVRSLVVAMSSPQGAGPSTLSVGVFEGLQIHLQSSPLTLFQSKSCPLPLSYLRWYRLLSHTHHLVPVPLRFNCSHVCVTNFLCLAVLDCHQVQQGIDELSALACPSTFFLRRSGWSAPLVTPPPPSRSPSRYVHHVRRHFPDR